MSTFAWVAVIIIGLVVLGIIKWWKQQTCDHNWGHTKDYESVCRKCGKSASSM